MADGIENWVGRAFAAIHPKNPLRRMLSDSDQKVLWALLMVYSFSSKRRRKGGGCERSIGEDIQSAGGFR
jgi:hypothetical protein